MRDRDEVIASIYRQGWNDCLKALKRLLKYDQEFRENFFIGDPALRVNCCDTCTEFRDTFFEVQERMSDFTWIPSLDDALDGTPDMRA
ncbi:hypothetical protein [Azospirillum sp. sgz301742]